MKRFGLRRSLIASSLVALLMCVGTGSASAQEGDAVVEERTLGEAAVDALDLKGSNCLGEGKQKTFIHNTIAGQINLLGLFWQTDLRFCYPLFPDDNVLLFLSNFTFGLTNFFAPASNFVGVFATFAPISLVEFGVRAMQVAQWPFIDGTGYIAHTEGGAAAYSQEWPWEYISRVDPINGIDIPLAHAGHGYRADWWVTLRGLVPFSDSFLLITQWSFMWEMWYMRSFFNEYDGNEYEFYYNSWSDMWLNNRDGMFIVDGVLFANHIIPGDTTNFQFRWGGQFLSRWAFLRADSGATNMLTGILLAFIVDEVGPMRNFTVLTRFAQWLQHPGFDALAPNFGQRINLALVISADWNLEWFTLPKDQR